MSDLVGNPEARFSRVEAQIIMSMFLVSPASSSCLHLSQFPIAALVPVFPKNFKSAKMHRTRTSRTAWMCDIGMFLSSENTKTFAFSNEYRENYISFKNVHVCFVENSLHALSILLHMISNFIME